jgi:hypothetical protein
MKTGCYRAVNDIEASRNMSKPSPPRPWAKTAVERKAERLAAGKRALHLFSQDVSMDAICRRMGRSDSYVRQGMREARNG